MSEQMPLPLVPRFRYWMPARDADLRCRAIFRRHYSYRAYADGRNPKKFVGPGEHIVLLGYGIDALFVWRKFISDDGQVGVNCSVFRNESSHRASDMIIEAMEIGWDRWPGERFYTYVNPKKIRSSNPGYCFKKAGWKVCGKSKKGLLILEAFPSPVSEMKAAA